MIDLGDRRIEDDGTVICTQAALMEVLYSGRGLSSAFCADEADQNEWQAAQRLLDDQSNGPIHADGPMIGGIDWFDHWMTPEPYASLDLEEWCLARCRGDQEADRVREEIGQFASRGMVPMAKHLMFCVDHWRTKGVVWGVGRGSSVSSFVLHLIGINRINPLEHDLPIGEWLK